MPERRPSDARLRAVLRLVDLPRRLPELKVRLDNHRYIAHGHDGPVCDEVYALEARGFVALLGDRVVATQAGIDWLKPKPRGRVGGRNAKERAIFTEAAAVGVTFRAPGVPR